MRLTVFFKLYKICIRLHRCNLKILANNRFEKSAIIVKFSNILQISHNFAKFQKVQLDNLVDFEKCCQTRIYLQNLVLIQPRTSPLSADVPAAKPKDREPARDGPHARGLLHDGLREARAPQRPGRPSSAHLRK